MDPDSALKEIREICSQMLGEIPFHDFMDAYRLAELVEGLDEWILKGGFLPKDWRAK